MGLYMGGIIGISRRLYLCPHGNCTSKSWRSGLLQYHTTYWWSSSVALSMGLLFGRQKVCLLEGGWVKQGEMVPRVREPFHNGAAASYELK